MGETQPDIEQLSLGSLIFRQWDRINSLSVQEFTSPEQRINTMALAIRLFRLTIPTSFLDKNFKEREQKISEKHKQILKAKKEKKNYNFVEDFENHSELLSLCIDLLATQGILYKIVGEGTYGDT